ncbi:MAG: YggS family pyridoxal phosphate-dependent enzyme [Anaerolineales bacterium]
MMEDRLVADIRERYQRVLERIEAAARRAGREPQSVRLVVVTKSQPLEVVRAALKAGVRIVGENYAEEALPKINSLKDEFVVEWHMIGHVQSRKAALVAAHFDLLHSLDSLKLARRLNAFCEQAGRLLPVMLEFNVGGEASKYGFPAWDESAWPALLPEIEAILQLPHLRLCGLMTMPPLYEHPEQSRPYFQRLRRLQAFLARHLPQADWQELSMGTSVDYETAIQEGATFVRIGTAIVGPRPSR